MAASVTGEFWRSSFEPEARRAWEPLVVFPSARKRGIESLSVQLRATIGRYLMRSGAILFRGFGVCEDDDFARFRAASAEPAGVGSGSGARRWLWCAVPQRGQRLLLADRRELYRAVPAGVRRRWAERGLVYHAHGDGACAEPARLSEPLAVHSQMGDLLWSCPEHAARAAAFCVLLGAAGARERSAEMGGLPRWSVTHADHRPLDELDVYEVNAAVESCRTELVLEACDVLLLDPELVAMSLELERDPGIVVVCEQAGDN